MRAPVKHLQGKKVTWDEPDEEWLRYHYWELEKSAHTISKEVGTTWSTVLNWMYYADVRCRTPEERAARQSAFMSSSAGPSWKGGHSRGWGRKVLQRAGVPKKCVWCGQGWEGPYSMHLHHRDHNKRNNALENLCWLCQSCNLLEARLWHMLKSGKIELSCGKRTITITFKKREVL